MSRPVLPNSFASQVRDLQRRTAVLERRRPGGGGGNPHDEGQVTFQKVGTLSAFTSIERWTSVGANVIDSVLAVVCGTPPTGADLVVDLLLNDGATSLWGSNPGNRPTVIEGTTTSNVSVPDTTAMANLDYIVPQIVQVGLATPGSDLIIQILYHTT